MSSLPSFSASSRRRSYSVGVSETGSPAHRHRALLAVDAQVADLEHRLARRPRPAQRGAEPGEQLVAAERLRHVVVGAGVERGDLLLLFSDRGEDEDRRRRPRAQLAADVGAAARPAAAGRGSPPRAGASPPARAPPARSRRCRRRSPRRAASSRARAGSAARRRRPARARRSRGVPRRGERERERRRRGPGPTRPRGGRRSPRGSRARSRGRDPSRAPPFTFEPRANGSKIDVLLGSRRCPGPSSTTRTTTSPFASAPPRPRPTCEKRSAFSKRFTSTRSICAASTSTVGGSAGSTTSIASPLGADRVERARDETVDRPDLERRAWRRPPRAARGRAGSRRAGRAACACRRIESSSSSRSAVRHVAARRPRSR